MKKRLSHIVQVFLSRRFGTAVSLGILLVVAAATGAADFLIRSSVRDVEKQSLSTGLDLVDKAIAREAAEADEAALRLANTPGDRSRLERISAHDIAASGFDYVAVLDQGGGLVLSKGPAGEPFPASVLSEAERTLRSVDSEAIGAQGFVLAPEGLFVLASRPGPEGGLAVAARKADSSFLALLRDETLQDLELRQVGAGARPQDNQRASRLEGTGGREYRVGGAWERIEASEVIRGAGGEVVAVATIRQERSIRAQAYRHVRLLVAANAAGALLVVLLVRLMLDFSRRQLQRRAAAERRYQVLVETAPDGILVLGADERVRLANAKAADLLGLPGTAALEGKAVTELVAPEGLGDLRAHVASVVATGAGGAELRLKRTDGRVMPVEVRSAVLPGSAEGDRAAIAFVRDVSERVAREGRIIALTEKLGLIARLSQRSGALMSREDYADLVMDSSLILVPGSMPSLWLGPSGDGAAAGEAGAGLVCIRGTEPGSRPLEGSAAVEAYRRGEAVFRERESGDCAIPLLAEGRAIGVFGLSLPDRRELDEADREALSVFSDQLAAGFETTRLYGETLERLRQLEALRTIDRAISSSASIEYVLAVILEQAVARLSVDAADILLYDRGAGELVFGARTGFATDALSHTRLRLGEGLAGRVAAERAPVVLPTLSREPSSFESSPDFALEGFRAYAGFPLAAKGELLGVLELHNRSFLEAPASWESFGEAIAGQAAIALDNAELLAGLHRANEELRTAYESTIEGWAEALELRDRETEGHSRRVTEASLELAEAYGFRGEALVSLRHGALLHDIGKMGIPDAILLKPGPLTPEEFDAMKRHTTISRDLLARLSFLGDAVDIPYAHHEKWDGTGYPRGLAGEDIPIAARLFSIVDVWDALRSDRPYRKGWSEERTLAYIEGLAGSQFDPRAAALFVAQRRSRSAS